MILSLDLNRAILSLAPAHIVRDCAPQTWRDIQESASFGQCVVWSGEANHSIYGDARVNYAFRAWHDTCHLSRALPFTIQGEEQAVAFQCEQLREAFPRCPKLWLDAIAADVLGVVYHLHNTGEYITDQTAHTLRLLSSPLGLNGIKPTQEIRRFAYGRD